MSKIFTRTFRVRWSETNAKGQVDITSHLRYLMETATDWGAAGQLSLDDIHALGEAWVIRETQFDFFRPLHYNDRFEFTIWLVEWRRVRGTRHFELKLRDSGEVVAQGAQQVAVLDSQTMRPISPPAHLLEYYLLEDPRILPTQRFPRLPSPPESAFVSERRVEERDLDQMDIVDNTVYASYVEEAAARALAIVGWDPAELKAAGLAVRNRRFHIQYQSPAVWGDRLQVSTYLLALGPTGGDWVVAVRRPDDGVGIMNCVLGWELVDLATGKVQRLPESLMAALGDRVVANS
jgi:YbgC/YbaW family acyl-CoA thioester hydrolase